MIIIEGMDNTGKTTLSKMLSEKLGLPLIHGIGPRPPEEQFERVLKMMTLDGLYPCIYDRIHCISDQVYAPIMARPDYWKMFPTGQRIFNELLAHHPLIIYCRPPLKSIITFDGRQQMDGVEDNAHQLIRAYDNMMSELARIPEVTLLRYDYTKTYGSLNRAEYSDLHFLTQTCKNHLALHHPPLTEKSKEVALDLLRKYVEQGWVKEHAIH